MELTPEFMRAFLVAGLMAMALLALVYLRQRRLSISEYLLWGLLAVLVPLLGPFLVIWSRPGLQSTGKTSPE